MDSSSEEADSKRHPVQPTVVDEHGTLRFLANGLVQYLLDKGGVDMNQLSLLQHKVPRRDYVQFAQLIGYSVSGFGELSYVNNEDWETIPEAQP